MNDIVAGDDNVEDRLAVQKDPVCLLERGKFELKKLVSNRDAILKYVLIEVKTIKPTFKPRGLCYPQWHGCTT